MIIRILLLLIFSISRLSAKSQKCHIGKSMEEVSSYYAKTIDTNFIWKFPLDNFLLITDAGSPPLHIVECYFENGACSGQRYLVEQINVKKYKSALSKNLQLKYDPTTKSWVERNGKYKWWWEKEQEAICYLRCERIR